jgi:cytochrome c553
MALHQPVHRRQFRHTLFAASPHTDISLAAARAKWICFLSVLVLVTGLWSSSIAGTEVGLVRGQALVNACAACHGPDGRSQGAIPSIDQLATDDFIAALQAFRADSRHGTVMNRIGKGVDDAEIAAMAAYLAARRSAEPRQP